MTTSLLLEANITQKEKKPSSFPSYQASQQLWKRAKSNILTLHQASKASRVSHTPSTLGAVDTMILLGFHLLLGRKAMTNLGSIIKSRNITLPTMVHLVKAMVLPAVMYGCESWTIKKAESRRIDAFELWCWRSLLRVLWTARRSNQSILEEVNPEYSIGRIDAEAEAPIVWPSDGKELTHWERQD